MRIAAFVFSLKLDIGKHLPAVDKVFECMISLVLSEVQPVDVETNAHLSNHIFED